MLFKIWHARHVILVIIGVFFLDRITKIFALQSGNFTLNTGIAFSIPLSNTLMLALTPVILLGLGWLARREFQESADKKIRRIILFTAGLLLGGALGNYADRIFYGGVIDFIDLKIWPSFNVADLNLTIAVILLLLFSLFHNRSVLK